MSACPECKGRKTITLLTRVVPCQACNGRIVVADPGYQGDRQKTYEWLADRYKLRRMLTLTDAELSSLATSDIDDEIGLAQTDLGTFTRLFWNVLEPSTPYSHGWHLDAINEHLEAVADGQIRNLLINMPPRHCKSLAVSVFFPVWMWLRKPETRFLYSSYALSLSIRDSRKCRQLIESRKFQATFGHAFRIYEDTGVTDAVLKLPFQLEDDQNQKIRFENDKMGYRIATSVGGAATGEGGDVVVSDDPHSVQEKDSDKVRESTLQWWDEVMSTRLNDQKTGRKIVVMQRVHENDLSGHILKQGGYEHLSLPAEYEHARRCTTSLGWSDPRTKEGELLWPARVGPKEIADLKIRLGPTGYAGQFQQIPTPAGGGRFKSADFRYWTNSGDFYRLFASGKEKVVIKAECYCFATMDPAGVDKQQNEKACYTSILVWAVTPESDMILLDEYHQQAETPATATAAIDMCRRFETTLLGVEKNGLGLGVVQTVALSGIAVIGINAHGSKEARSETAEIRLAAGKVYFPAQAPWMFEFQTELERFPNGEFCDRVDAFSHAAAMVQARHGAPSSDTPSNPVEAGRFKSQF